MPIVIEVPNRGRIELPDGTPEAEIDSIVSKEFPPTGEDIAQRLAEDPTFRLDDQQFAEFEKYSKAKQADWVNAIASGVDSLVQTATTAAVEGVKGAALNPANYLEGFGQGTRQLYGFAAQSQDPGSPMFRFKDLIAGTGTLQSRREQFNQARDFNEQSLKYESGQETMLPKELVNPEFAQGVSLVADPTMLIPGLGQVFGAEKLVAKAIGKGAQVAGRTIKGPAGLINRAVSVAESALTQTAGMSPEAFRAGLSTTGVLGVAGVADPTAGLIASVPVAARTAAGFGAGLEEVGTGLLRAPSRIGALESLGMTPDASLARRAIGFAGRFGGDTALNTGIAATAGAAEGALVGGGMGYLSGGEEGAAVGIGSGLAAGAPGAVLGRVYQGMTGQLARDARVNDLARYVSTLSDNKRSVYESVQKRFGTDVAANLMDLEALVRGKRNDISVDLLNESDFKTATGGVIARGIVPDENSPTPRILVNVDALSKGAGDNPIYTFGHELVHALGVSKQFQGDLAGITERLTGTYVPNPDGTFKLVEAGQYTPANVEELFNQYLNKLPEGVRQQVLTDNPTAADRANYVGEELVAEQVGRILSSQKPDAFLRNFGTLKSDFTDWLIVKEAYEKVSKVGQWIESKFGVKPSDSILFPQIKETSPVLDATLRQLLRARTNLDEAINRADFRKTFSINAKNISDPTVADLAIKGGFAVRNADGTVRLLTNGELLQRDTQDVILARETLGRVPGAKMDINGSLDKAPTPEQVAAINASTGISSHMKERFAMASQSIADGRSIFGEYYPATERVKDTSSNRWRIKYAPRKVTLRDTLPYNLLFSKENNAYIRGIDITKIRSEIQKHVRAGGVAGLWPDVGAFMSDLAAYFTNRDRGEAGLPTRELLGPDKAKFMGDFLNRFEKGGSEFVHSFRLDRFGEMRPGDFRARFSETGYKGMKDRLMPAGQVGDTESFKSESGYTVLAKNNKFRLYGPGGELLGIYDSPQQAERKINATETRLQSKIDQQQRPQGNEGRQTAEAGGGDRPERGPQGGEGGGQVRQAGDVRFMPEGEVATEKQVAEGLPRRASFEAQGVTRDENGNIFFKGKEPKDWSPKDFEDYGKAFGVQNLGPLSPIVEVPSDVAGAVARIPGGLDGKFTYYDLLWLKANPVDVAKLPETTHAKLTAKLASTMSPTPGDKVASFNSIVFGMLSPNAPLLPNEMGQARLRFGSMDEIRKFAELYPSNPTPENLKALNERFKRQLGFIAAGKGGLGIPITADITNVANAARLFVKNPDFFVKRPNESWANFVDKLTTQVKGFGTKTGSFGSVWQDPFNASISAMDRHMARIFGQELLGNPELRKRFDGIVVDRFNSLLTKAKDVSSRFNRKLKTAEAAQARIEEKNKGNDELIKQLKSASQKKIEKIKADMASELDALPDPSATKAKTIDDVLGQAEIYGVDRVQKFVNEAVFAAMGSRKATLLAKKGGINPNAPEHIKGIDWIETPADFQVMSDAYRSALEINERRAGELGIAVFPAQWTLWDRIRQRVEPHEVMFPGLEKLPALNDRQLADAYKANKVAGYMSTPEAGRKWKRSQIDSPSRLAYFMPQPDPSVPGAYSVTGGFRILPGKTGGRLRVYGPAGSLMGIAGSLDEAQRMIRRKNRF